MFQAILNFLAPDSNQHLRSGGQEPRGLPDTCEADIEIIAIITNFQGLVPHWPKQTQVNARYDSSLTTNTISLQWLTDNTNVSLPRISTNTRFRMAVVVWVFKGFSTCFYRTPHHIVEGPGVVPLQFYNNRPPNIFEESLVEQGFRNFLRTPRTKIRAATWPLVLSIFRKRRKLPAQTLLGNIPHAVLLSPSNLDGPDPWYQRDGLQNLDFLDSPGVAEVLQGETSSRDESLARSINQLDEIYASEAAKSLPSIDMNLGCQQDHAHHLPGMLTPSSRGVPDFKIASTSRGNPECSAVSPDESHSLAHDAAMDHKRPPPITKVQSDQNKDDYSSEQDIREHVGDIGTDGDPSLLSALPKGDRPKPLDDHHCIGVPVSSHRKHLHEAASMQCRETILYPYHSSSPNSSHIQQPSFELPESKPSTQYNLHHNSNLSTDTILLSSPPENHGGQTSVQEHQAIDSQTCTTRTAADDDRNARWSTEIQASRLIDSELEQKLLIHSPSHDASALFQPRGRDNRAGASTSTSPPLSPIDTVHSVSTELSSVDNRVDFGNRCCGGRRSNPFQGPETDVQHGQGPCRSSTSIEDLELPFPDDYWTYDGTVNNYYHIETQPDESTTMVWYPDDFA